MISVERTGLIAAPIDAVWAVLADFASISSWAPNVDHSCLMSEQTEGVGTVRRIQTDRYDDGRDGRELGAGSDAGVPDHRTATGHQVVTNTWRLGASGDSTMVRLTTDIDAGPRPPQQIIAKVVGRRLAAASEQMIAGLTDHVVRGDAT